ncbi:MAG: tRNA (adenosine(37)-N6)-dimethylallyltransferase MiaA [Clostridia bacterium]|nr:tRNA (adenosine(37)-N6)-dimethylallyltransferase MiaA [Clostridia bacterium]
MKKLYGICGPTASGKTALAVRLCERLKGEIISADSMQVYTGFDILSAQPTPEEMQRAPHHLVSFVPPDEKYNASKYRSDALYAISEVEWRGKLPVLCGGSGLYIDALTKGIRMSVAADEEIRLRLKETAAKDGGQAELYAELKRVDPASARKYAPEDTRRIIRSLEIYYATGKTRSEQERIDAQQADTFKAVLFALRWDKKKLYERCDRRVDEMIKRGLITEVEGLLKSPVAVQETAAQAIGYKEIARALKGEISIEAAVEEVKLHTRHLAKRQETWFRRDTRVSFFDVDEDSFDCVTDKIYNIIKEDILNDRCR